MSSEDNNHNGLHLEKKLWYRFVKVIYFVFFFLFVLFVVMLASSERPYVNVDSNKSLITCNNGKIYSAGKNSIYLDSDGSLSDYNEENVRKLCEYDILNDYLDKYKRPENVNYKLNVGYYGSWEEVIKILVIGEIIVFLVFEIIKRVFLYIAVGKSMIPKVLSDD